MLLAALGWLQCAAAAAPALFVPHSATPHQSCIDLVLGEGDQISACDFADVRVKCVSAVISSPGCGGSLPGECKERGPRDDGVDDDDEVCVCGRRMDTRPF